MKTVLLNADFVIEGCVDPTEPLRDEGPFGDHTGYYTLPEPYPVFHVTAITHRKDAVYPATNLVFVSIRKTYPMQAYRSPCGRPPSPASGAWAR